MDWDRIKAAIIATPSRSEWDALLTSKRADLALETLAAGGTLKLIFPELQRLVGFGGEGTGHKDLWEHTKIVVAQTLPRPMLRWAALFHDCGKPDCFSRVTGEITFHGHEVASARLFRQAARRSQLFHGGEIKHISDIIRLLGKVEQYTPAWSDTAVRRLARDLGGLTHDVVAVARADCSSKRADRRQANYARYHALETRLTEIAQQDELPPALPHGLGDVIMQQLGFTPSSMTHEQGLEMRRIMGALKAMVEAGELPRCANAEIYLEVLPAVRNSR